MISDFSCQGMMKVGFNLHSEKFEDVRDANF